MSDIIEIKQLSRVYGKVSALEEIDLNLAPNRIYGLLGRNGAGKTTLLKIIGGQEFSSSGKVRVMGQEPAENPQVTSNLAFVAESIRYPDNYRAAHVLSAARISFRNWDESFALSLIRSFAVPLDREVKKLSRGQFSALGVVVGLASRAELTIFDEPYIGMDAIARKLFYDSLLADYLRHPRTIILSTHLIDEVADLIEQVVVIENGRITLNDDSETLLSGSAVLEGVTQQVVNATAGLEILDSETVGSQTRVMVTGVNPAIVKEVADLGLSVKPLSLQQLLVAKSNSQSAQKASH